jgi:hypothetical protein
MIDDVLAEAKVIYGWGKTLFILNTLEMQLN